MLQRGQAGAGTGGRRAPHCRGLAGAAEGDDWFLHVHVWDPHIPYRTPEKYGKPFADAPLPDGWMTEEILQYHRASKPGAHSACEVNGYRAEPDAAHPRQITEIASLADFRALIDEYDTGVWYADRFFGRLTEILKEQGIYEDTAIIVSSDHGEDLGELGSYCEHGQADEVVTHIPLIIKWPGCARGPYPRGSTTMWTCCPR